MANARGLVINHIFYPAVITAAKNVPETGAAGRSVPSGLSGAGRGWAEPLCPQPTIHITGGAQRQVCPLAAAASLAPWPRQHRHGLARPSRAQPSATPGTCALSAAQWADTARHGATARGGRPEGRGRGGLLSKDEPLKINFYSILIVRKLKENLIF